MKWKPLHGPILLLLALLRPPDAKAASPQGHPLRIFPSYGANLDQTSQTQTPIQKLVQRVLMPAAMEWLSKAIRIPSDANTTTTIYVKRACTNGFYLINRQRFCISSCAATTACGEATVPQAHLEECSFCDPLQTTCRTKGTKGSGVSGHDIILYVTAVNTSVCQSEPGISHSLDCQKSSKLDRPIVGNLNICPNRVSYLEKDYYWQVQYLIHDIIHVLAFSPNLFGFFHDSTGSPLTPRNPNTGLPPKLGSGFGWSSKVISSGQYKNWEVASGSISRSAFFMVTPKVKEAARNHFNCPTLQGAELESQKHRFFHWESRLFQGDSLTGQMHRNLVISNITLAVLEDSGWYSVDYSFGQKLTWGKGLGCRFATSSCLGYINSQQKSKQPISPFCKTRPSASVVTCNVDRSAMAQCNMKDYPNALPSEFQYFTGSGGFSNRTGGGDAEADYCPYYQNFPVNSKQGSSCYVESNAPGDNVALEDYGVNTKCLNHGRHWSKKAGTLTTKRSLTGAGCYQISCALQQLRIWVGGAWYTCSAAGQEILISKTISGVRHSGSIVCPRFDEVCQGHGCPGDCSHHGRCTSAKTCVCDPGYFGSNCSQNRFDQLRDCMSQPCQNSGNCIPTISGFQCSCISGTSGTFCEVNADECASNPCENGGMCTDEIGNYTCTCKTGYKGKHCETEVKECDSNPCQNGGVCKEMIGLYSCACPGGYGGANCAFKTQKCPTCLNNGVCRSDNSGKCDCAVGFTGIICQTPVDYCSPDPCLNGGSCQMTKDGYQCTCTSGFKGKNCDAKIIPCSVGRCQNGATCKDTPLGYQCLCPDGFTGQDCAVNVDECLSSPCRNNATCVDLIGDFMCRCRDGFTGHLCEINIDECHSSPCLHNGICHDHENSFDCECQIGYEGTICETDVDECAKATCLNGGSCVDGIGTYQCNCQAGFTGSMCETELLECASDPCQNGGTCVEAINGYQCRCPAGFTGVLCESDVDDCAPNPCKHGGRCIDGVNKFTCNCSTGFTGVDCQTNIDDCVVHSCLNGAACVDGINSYTCACPSKFTGPKCGQKTNACDDTTCGNGGTCINTAGHFLCFCPSDFSGLLCESEIDSCASNPCPPDSQCNDHRIGFSCDECTSSSPCLHGGRCVDTVTGFACQCPAGFAGVRCAIDVNECDSEPCLNGGTCIDGANGYTCVCRAGFEGFQCERDTDECASLPCLNNGLCFDRVDGFECQCQYDYGGRRCEIPPGDCRATPCLNGGNCTTAGGGKFQCVCPVGFGGSDCSVPDIDECLSNPCLHNGSCVNRLDGYECICCGGFTGANCEANIDDCVGSLCQNGGSCIDGVNGYSCLCPRRFTGQFCTERIDPCASSPCKNNGTCTSLKGKSPDCDCQYGYAGKRCQLKLSGGCAEQPCNNGGLCVVRAGSGRIKCQCARGYSGRQCEIIDDPCATEPCKNGGRCERVENFLGGFKCLCEAPFEGDRCEIRRGPCRPNPCQNGGACLEEDNELGFLCRCTFGYRGRRCEKVVNVCDSRPCRNDGLCHPTASGAFKCSCAYPFTGDNCSDTISTPSFQRRSYFGLTPLLKGVGSSFSLAFSFNPRSGNGVMFLTSQKQSGEGNYLSLELKNRWVRLAFDFGSGRRRLVSEEKVTLGKWHTVKALCDGDYQELVVDSQTPVRRPLTSGERKPQLSRRVFIGYKNLQEFHVRGFSHGLLGCFSDLTVNSVAIQFNSSIVLQSSTIKECDCNDECSLNKNSCFNGGTCVKLSNKNTCACPHGFSGPLCDRSSLFEKPYFSDSSYLEVPALNLSGRSIAITFSIRLSGPDGLVLFLSEFDDGSGDFIVLYLHNSHLVYGCDSGSGAGYLRSNNPLTVGREYYITVRKIGRECSLEIDHRFVSSVFSTGPFESITLRDALLLGGSPSAHSLPAPVMKDIGRTGSVGCIWSVSINQRPVEVSSYNPNLRAVGVRDCGESVGAMCLTPQPDAPPCVRNLNFKVPSFSGQSYLQYSYLPESSRRNQWTLDFKVTSGEGIVLYVGQVGNATDDYLSVKLVDSVLQLRVRLGGGKEREIAGDLPVSLGSWHALDVTRNDNIITMAVDHQKFSGSSPGSTTTMSTDLKVFLGGLPRRYGAGGVGMAGCIRSVYFDGIAVALRDEAVDGQSIKECPS
eukprot:m.40098 g.40098  ORF g.40098 m.40098 type:complete len:2143 (+) comp32899_c1_seq1:130-6558(+)